MFIKKEIDKAKQLTIFTVDGELDIDELSAHYKSYYEDEKPSKNVIWDFRSAVGGSKLTNELIKYYASFPKRYAHKRPVGKTAFVVKGDFSYGLGRMMAAFAEIEYVKLTVNVFRSMDQAIQWLDEEK